MQICDACKCLAAAPVRLVRPTHLRPLALPGNRMSGSGAGSASAYHCESCESRWHWGVSGNWVLLLPVAQPARQHSMERRWWASIVEAISRWRTRRRLRPQGVAYRLDRPAAKLSRPRP
jgi:hypothetical protein